MSSIWITRFYNGAQIILCKNYQTSEIGNSRYYARPFFRNMVYFVRESTCIQCNRSPKLKRIYIHGLASNFKTFEILSFFMEWRTYIKLISSHRLFIIKVLQKCTFHPKKSNQSLKTCRFWIRNASKVNSDSALRFGRLIIDV